MKTIKWFWIWEDEKKENWLHEMAQKGYRLDAIHFPCVYSFMQIQPSNIHYRLDFWNSQRLSFEQYMQSRTEEGWKLVSKLNGWLYFCKTAKENEVPVSTNSDQAKADKYQQLMTFLVGFLPVMLLWYPIIDNRLKSPLYEILGIVFVLSLAIFIISTFMIYRRISELREL
jgi:hypothetical protein